MIYLLIFVLFCLPICIPEKINIEDTIWSRHYTSVMKGVAILCIVLCHYMGRYGNGIRWFTPLGGIGVAIFLVLSAYGLNESWIHFGYKHWWSKRILSVVVPYAIAQLCIYWPFHNFLFKECILDILCIEVKYIYGWYLPYLLFWYIIFYIVKRIKFLEKNEMIIFCIISILLLLSTKGVQGEQSFSFAFGVFLSRNKNSKKLETKINIKTAFVLLSVGIGFLIIKQIPFIRTVPYMIYNMVEMAIKLPCALGLMMVIFFSSNVLNSKYLSWIGSISYEIYLLHGYILNRTSISLTGSVLFISVTFLSSIIYWFFIEQIIGRLKQIIEI